MGKERPDDEWDLSLTGGWDYGWDHLIWGNGKGRYANGAWEITMFHVPQTNWDDLLDNWLDYRTAEMEHRRWEMERRVAYQEGYQACLKHLLRMYKWGCPWNAPEGWPIQEDLA